MLIGSHIGTKNPKLVESVSGDTALLHHVGGAATSKRTDCYSKHRPALFHLHLDRVRSLG